MQKLVSYAKCTILYPTAFLQPHKKEFLTIRGGPRGGGRRPTNENCPQQQPEEPPPPAAVTHHRRQHPPRRAREVVASACSFVNRWRRPRPSHVLNRMNTGVAMNAAVSHLGSCASTAAGLVQWRTGPSPRQTNRITKRRYMGGSRHM